jgi:hypothetical protein
MRAEDALLGQARALATAVDREFDLAEALLNGLAVSSALARGDLAAFEGEMRAASAQFDGAAITLVTADGHIALMTVWPPGERRTGHRGADGAIQTLATGRPQISNLFRGAATGKFAVAIGIPVFAESSTAGQRAVASTIGLALPQARLATALE